MRSRLGKAVLRVPVLLYRAHLGRILGRRFILLEHRGRKSGRLYSTVLEVVALEHDPLRVVVMSGFGPTASWFRNVTYAGTASVQIGGDRFSASPHVLAPDEAAAVLADYERRNRLAAPLVRRVLSKLSGVEYDGSDPARLEVVKRLPLVRFVPEQ